MTDAPPDLPPPPTAMADELSRLTALYGSGLLDEGPQVALDTLVNLAADLLGCPTAMLSLVDRDTVHLRSAGNSAVGPLPRPQAMCDRTIDRPDGLVIDDLTQDRRYADTPLVAQGLRFYAGAPIHARDGDDTPRAIGTLCVTDTTPRRFDEAQRRTLRRLAAMADVLIAASADARCAVAIANEHKQLVGELARQHRIFAQAERMTGVGAWRMSLPDERLEWSEGVYHIYGLPVGESPQMQAALDPYPPEARGRVAAVLAEAIEHCSSFDFEEDFRPTSGELRRVRCIGECEEGDGGVLALVGVFQDVTERHRMETALRHDADTDALTGLLNRAAFDKRLKAAIVRSGAEKTPLLLALVDLDGFKAVNDTLGHAAGDDVLRAVGAALRSLPFQPLLVARIGGDEFALLIDDPHLAADPAALTDLLRPALMVAARGGGLTLSCSGSVGTAALDGGESARDIMHRADVALYAAKRGRVGEPRQSQQRRGEQRRAA
jgi:diguanylate cyclase (GGDEF)-like protein